MCCKEESRNKQSWQQEVQMTKSENLLDPALHAEFLKAASEALPKALQNLKNGKSSLDHFFGLLGGVMIGTSGHRPCVIMNLTTEEFLSAKEGKDGHAIFVKNHKTNNTFGHAILPITNGEYNCMAEFLKIRGSFEGSQSAHFFFNKKGGLYKGLLKAFMNVWEDMGLPKPAPTFMSLRTSMSTQVQKHLSLKEVQNATALMCHRPQTALKFYKAYCSVEEALELRKSMTKSIKCGEGLSRKQMVESGSSLKSNEGLVEECDERNVCPVETMETEVVKSVALQCTAKAVESNQGDQETETVIPQGRHPHQNEESVSVEAIEVFSSGADERTQEPTEETVFVSDNANTTVEATTTSSTAEQEELIKSPPANKICGSQRRAAQTSKNEMAKAPAVLSLIEEENLTEEVFDQPAVDTSPHLPVTEEHTETMVKSVRGNRNTKQSKMTVVVEVHAVADPAPSVAVVSSHARNAVTKAKSEVTENVASSEKPVKPVKHTRRTAKAPGSKKENTIAQADSELLAANENVKLLRRGKAVAPSACKTSTHLKRKSNVVIEVADESINKEPLPKRRGRVASSSEVVAEVSTKEKTSEAEPKKAEPTLKKTYNRVARGQKMTAQEPDPAPTKAQASVSGTTTRKGRSVKKVEKVDVPTEAAPVRCTRRK
ncbi:uncharacterized protein LOC109079132 [Cyprinus carpio]|uniref:Uncharacterized protein LOC109079132 n=1 Tax=Cyprinus carpio TaxID=7962 RepID=A0A9Q9WR27_CYPCA|nr:uncharacterized protein LOC109079132 [Cyprinus carpio]